MYAEALTHHVNGNLKCEALRGGKQFFYISIYVVLCENTVSAKMDFHTLSFSIEFVRIYVGKMPCTFAEYQLFNQLLGYWFLIVGFFMCISKKSGKKWKLMELKSSYVVCVCVDIEVVRLFVRGFTVKRFYTWEVDILWSILDISVKFIVNAAIFSAISFMLIELRRSWKINIFHTSK